MQVLLVFEDFLVREVSEVHLAVLAFLVLTAYKFRWTDGERRDMLDVQVLQ